MPPKVLTENQLPDADADKALTTLPPIPDNVLVLLRNLQAQVTSLEDRVAP
jgi:hypothetical protein